MKKKLSENNMFDNWIGVKKLKTSDTLTDEQKQAGNIEGLIPIHDKEKRLWRYKK